MPPPPPPRRPRVAGGRRPQQQRHEHHVMYINGIMNGNNSNNNSNNSTTTTGIRQSRVLWDEARYCHNNNNNDKDHIGRGACNSHNNSTTNNNIRIIQQKLIKYCRAIGYELQFIRYSQIIYNVPNVRSMLLTMYNICTYCILSTPYVIKTIFTFIITRTKYQWYIVVCIILYYYFVKLIHE